MTRLGFDVRRPDWLLESGSHWRRHQRLLAELAPLGKAKRLPGAWHALWRLPPRMKWDDPAGELWVCYPSVSFAMEVHPLQGATDENER